MIYYATRQTLQRYKIKTLDEIFAGEVTPEEARFLAQVRQESGIACMNGAASCSTLMGERACN